MGAARWGDPSRAPLAAEIGQLKVPGCREASPGASLPAAPSGDAPVLAEGPICSQVGKLRQQRRSLHGARGPAGAGGDHARHAEPGSNPKGHPQPWHRPRPLPQERRKGAAILLPRYVFHPRLWLASAAATGLGEKRVEGGVRGCGGGDVGCPRCWADRGRPLRPCTSWWKGCVSKPASRAGLRRSEHPHPSLPPPHTHFFCLVSGPGGCFPLSQWGWGSPGPTHSAVSPTRVFLPPFRIFG